MTRNEAINILGLTQKNIYTEEEIKKAYRFAMNQNHPDHGGNEEQAKKINEARGILSNKHPLNNYINNVTFEVTYDTIERIYYSLVIEDLLSSDYYAFFSDLYTYVVPDLYEELYDTKVKNREELTEIVSKRIINFLLKSEKEFCESKGINITDLRKYGYQPPTLPIDTHKYLTKLKIAYINYQKNYVENYINKMDNETEKYKKIIDNLPYDECMPLASLIDYLNERIERYLVTNNYSKDVNYLNYKLKEYVFEINKIFAELLIKSGNSFDIINDINAILRRVKTLEESFNAYKNISKEACEKLLEDCVEELKNAQTLINKSSHNLEEDYNVKALKAYLIIDITRVKIPFIITEFIDIIDKINKKEIFNGDLLVERYYQIAKSFAELYGVNYDELVNYASNPLKKIDLFYDRINFNEMDDFLSTAYKKYVFNYVKRIINIEANKDVSKKEKQEIAEKIFRNNLYILKMSDINDILSESLVIEEKNNKKAL